MADEMIAPLMNSDDNQEEKNENEESPLLINNKKEKRKNIQHIDNNRAINRELTDNQKMSLIFLSFAIQILIYFLFLRHFNDKDNFIKQHINIFFTLSIIIALYLFIQTISDFNFFQRISFIYLISISLISSFSLFCFLYKFTILYTFDIIKYILLIVCSTYLNISFNYCCGFAQDNIENEIFINFCILPFSISFILIICRIFSLNAFIFNISLSFFLCFLSIFHMYYLVYQKNYGINDYPIINICLFMDIVITTIYFLIMYLSSQREIRKYRNRYGRRNRFSPNKKEIIKGKLILTPYDVLHPNETDKNHH